MAHCGNPAVKMQPSHFIDEEIKVVFNTPLAREKTPPCPDGFIWPGNNYAVVETLSEWTDFARRGRMARNMRPAHAAAAAKRGSLGVGGGFHQLDDVTVIHTLR